MRLDCKISFHYQKYTIQDRTQQVDRCKGAKYTLSPYKLIISDGYYYLLAWDSKKGSIVTYRLDRMKDVEVSSERREGFKEFSQIDIGSYTQQHFGMFSGQKKRVSLRFTNNLLDTMVDRFGTGTGVGLDEQTVGQVSEAMGQLKTAVIRLPWAALLGAGVCWGCLRRAVMDRPGGRRLLTVLGILLLLPGTVGVLWLAKINGIRLGALLERFLPMLKGGM